MSLTRFRQPITTVEELRSLVGTPGPLALKKELPALDEHMRRFIGHAPFVILSTVSGAGRCDASPRGDAPGFVRVLDERTLVVPERPGNKRVDSMRNILETGRVGLLFLIPGVGETLRVNGRAAVIRDPDILETMTAGGKTPAAAIAVETEECYLQCAKALLRSKLWEPHAPPARESLACAAEMLAEQAQMPEYDTAGMQQLLDNAYKNLY